MLCSNKNRLYRARNIRTRLSSCIAKYVGCYLEIGSSTVRVCKKKAKKKTKKAKKKAKKKKNQYLASVIQSRPGYSSNDSVLALVHQRLVTV